MFPRNRESRFRPPTTETSPPEPRYGIFHGDRLPMTDNCIEIVIPGIRGGAAATAEKKDPRKPDRTNQDRCVVAPHMCAVADGVGSSAAGELAAQTLAEELLKQDPETDPSFQAIIDRTIERYQADPAIDDSSGACFAACRIVDVSGEQEVKIEVTRVGDCRIIIVAPDGTKIQYHSLDESQVQYQIEKRAITVDEGLVAFAFSNQTTRDVSKTSAGLHSLSQIDSEELLVPRGSRVIMMSDGVIGNFSNAELIRAIAGKNSRDAIAYLDALIDQRLVDFHTAFQAYCEKKSLKTFTQIGRNEMFMLKRQYVQDVWAQIDPVTGKPRNHFDDGFKAWPQRDDRTMIILDI